MSSSASGRSDSKLKTHYSKLITHNLYSRLFPCLPHHQRTQATAAGAVTQKPFIKFIREPCFGLNADASQSSSRQAEFAPPAGAANSAAHAFNEVERQRLLLKRGFEFPKPANESERLHKRSGSSRFQNPPDLACQGQTIEIARRSRTENAIGSRILY